jgi:L1 cell adhesion molecule like protein
MIGRTMDDEKMTKDLKHWLFHVKNNDKKPLIVLDNAEGKVEMAPVEVSAKILEYMKENAKTHLGSRVTHAVITVPLTLTKRSGKPPGTPERYRA